MIQLRSKGKKSREAEDVFNKADVVKPQSRKRLEGIRFKMSSECLNRRSG